MTAYIPILLFMVVVTGLAALILALTSVLGAKRTNPAKEQPFETGNPPTPGSTKTPFPVHFYLVAILFVVFDLEIAFLYPWAVKFRELGLFGLIEMFVFLGVLTAGWYFIIKRGVLGWR